MSRSGVDALSSTIRGDWSRCGCGCARPSFPQTPAARDLFTLSSILLLINFLSRSRNNLLTFRRFVSSLLFISFLISLQRPSEVPLLLSDYWFSVRLTASIQSHESLEFVSQSSQLAYQVFCKFTLSIVCKHAHSDRLYVKYQTNTVYNKDIVATIISVRLSKSYYMIETT